ncbi:MAG: hypothetical protein QXV48_04915 [Desulfurococcaceae archaeon]
MIDAISSVPTEIASNIINGQFSRRMDGITRALAPFNRLRNASYFIYPSIYPRR